MNILLIDDDSLVTLSLKTILESNEDIRVTGIGECGRDAVRLFEKLKPDILLMDIRMADMNGIEAGLEILKAHPDAKILYLTTFSDDEYIVKALAMGAKGYNNKEIAEKIYLSEGTVRNYLSSLLEKLDLRDRTQLAVYYYTEMNK